MLGYRSARFHPVAAIDIQDRPHLADGRMVNMPAHDNLRALMFGVRNHGIFKRANEADRLLYHRLGGGGE